MSIEPVSSAMLTPHDQHIDPAMPGSAASHAVGQTSRRNDLEDHEALSPGIVASTTIPQAFWWHSTASGNF
jgi:hypothetical protein